mgnify:CR=1 FL=1
MSARGLERRLAHDTGGGRFGIEHYWAFIAAVLTFQLVPGAGTIAIISSTAIDGRRAGTFAVLGTLIGDFVFMSLAAAGVANLLRANATWFHALQIAGALYLVWMGIGQIRASWRNSDAPEPQSMSAGQHLRKAAAVSLSNPKVMLFFVGFFPLFLPVTAPTSTLLWMMAHVTALSALYQLMLVVAGNAAALRLGRLPGARKFAQRLAGVVLIGTDGKLATSLS